MNAQDVYYFVLAVVALVVGGFLSWALYELAMLLKQGNEVTARVRDGVADVEESILDVKDRLESSLRVLGMLTEGGKAILGTLMGRSLDDDEEERPRRRLVSTSRRRKSLSFEE